MQWLEPAIAVYAYALLLVAVTTQCMVQAFIGLSLLFADDFIHPFHGRNHCWKSGGGKSQ